VAPIGPYSRPHRLRKLDGRTHLGRHLRDFERGLIGHVGGRPNPVQWALIDQAVALKRQIALLESAGLETDHDRRSYAAWNSHLRLTLRELGLKGAAPRPPTLEEAIAAGRAAIA
jgi:hypothetical protein